MKNALTHEQAAAAFCPMTFGGDKWERCQVAWCAAWRYVEQGATGYCGMAGQPIEVAADIAAAKAIEIVKGAR